MRRLILLRHAKAVGHGPGSDRGRDLAARGRDEAAWVGVAIDSHGWAPALALVSDARRTKATFDIAAAALKRPPTLQIVPALYDAEPEQVLAVVAAAPPSVESLLVVGHNPSIALVALRLAAAGDAVARSQLRQGFPPGAMAVVALAIPAWSAIATAKGSLDALLTPP